VKNKFIIISDARLQLQLEPLPNTGLARRAIITFGLVWLAIAVPSPVIGADAQLVVTGFSGFLPSTLAPLGRPTNIRYSLQNFGPGSLGNLSGGTGPVLIDLWLSSNTSFGDGDGACRFGNRRHSRFENPRYEEICRASLRSRRCLAIVILCHKAQGIAITQPESTDLDNYENTAPS
jgi:hypothetical protein